MRCSICSLQHNNKFYPKPDGVFIFKEELYGTQTLCLTCEKEWIADNKEALLLKIRNKILNEHKALYDGSNEIEEVL